MLYKRTLAEKYTLAKLAVLITLGVISIGLPSLVYHPKPPAATATPSLKSIDPILQTIATNSLSTALDRTDAQRGGVVVIDAYSGTIKALVSTDRRGSGTPTDNIITDAAWEPGSVMKPLTIAAALNERAISLSTTFYDSGETYVQGFRVTNATQNQPRTITIQDIVTQSINTGTINVLRRLGGSEDINDKARQILYQYFTDHYHFGDNGIPGETTGFVPRPNVGDKLELEYANMAFGQSMTVTPLQLVRAYAAVLNGGTYFAPQLDGKGSHVLSGHVVSDQTSGQIRQLLQKAFAANNRGGLRSGYAMGGKTGTAHVATLSGDYYNNHRDNGTYIGFVANAKTMYIMLVRLDEPNAPDHSFASTLARETWDTIATTKIDTTGTFSH